MASSTKFTSTDRSAKSGMTIQNAMRIGRICLAAAFVASLCLPATADEIEGLWRSRKHKKYFLILRDQNNTLEVTRARKSVTVTRGVGTAKWVPDGKVIMRLSDVNRYYGGKYYCNMQVKGKTERMNVQIFNSTSDPSRPERILHFSCAGENFYWDRALPKQDLEYRWILRRRGDLPVEDPDFDPRETGGTGGATG